MWMKSLQCLGKALLALLLVMLAAGLFLRYQGLQYTIGFTTGAWGSAPDPGVVAGPPCNGVRPCESKPIRVMSFNIFCRLCSQPDSGYEPWELRVPQLVEVIQRHQPDIIGFQETGTQADMDDLLLWNPAYALHTWRGGPLMYADAALAYDATRFQPIDSGWFFLNPNPTVPFGWAWQWQSMPRYVAWVWLREIETGFVFLFTNTHFDNNPPNKEASAFLFNDMLADAAGAYPVISTGDYNTNATPERYRNLLGGDPPRFRNAHDLAEAPFFPENAIRGRYAGLEDVIDHILIAGPAEAVVTEWLLEPNLYDGDRRASDHPAIVAEVTLRLP